MFLRGDSIFGPHSGGRSNYMARLSLGLAGLFLLVAPVQAHEPGSSDGVSSSGFVAPAPGSYALSRIMDAPEGAVLDMYGKAHSLSRYTSGKVTVLGFVYTTCSDSRGCPLAYHVF